MMPKISVLIATLNEEKNIAKLLQSLRDQTFQDFEILIVDSYSADKTVEIAKNFGANVILAPKGIALARNLAAKAASGNILFFTDADVILPRNHLAKLCAFIQNYDAIAGTGVPNDSNILLELEYWPYNLFRVLTNCLPRPFKTFSTSGYNLAIKRAVFFKTGGWPDVKINDDGELGRRLLNSGAKVRFYRSLQALISARRAEKSGVVGFNKYFIFVLENFFPFLRPLFSKAKEKSAAQFHSIRQT